MAAAKKKRSTRAQAARSKSAAAVKGWETRRARERELKRKHARAAKKAAATRERKRLEHERRSQAAKKGARRHTAKVRASEALRTFRGAVEAHAAARELAAVRRSWHKSKGELFRAVDDDYDHYLAILEDIADETDTSWDIAYGPEESAA